MGSKIIAVLIIEGLALLGTSGYFLWVREFDKKYVFGLVLGAASILIMLLLREKKSEKPEPE